MDNVVSVDISALFEGSEHAHALVDQQILDAIRNHGGFVISGFPGADQIDALCSKMMRFFDLNESEKLKTAKAVTKAGAPNIYCGYESNLKPGSFAYNEIFDIGPKAPSPALTEGSRIFAETNIWPETEPAEGWRAAMETYYDILHRVGMAVLHAMGRAIDLPADRLEQVFRTGNSTLRLINYPVPPEDGLVTKRSADEENLKISAAEHTERPACQSCGPCNAVCRPVRQMAPGGTSRNSPIASRFTKVMLLTQ